MLLSQLRTYWKFLMRNKLYTLVCVTGFSISLMFVIILGVHVKQELSFDKFHEKGDRIYFMVTENGVSIANPVGPLLYDNIPEVEDFCRAISQRMTVELGSGEKIGSYGLLADSTFFRMFSFELADGNPEQVLREPNSIVVTRAFANTVLPGKYPVGETVNLLGADHIVTGMMEDFPYNTHFPESEFVASYASFKYIGGDGIFEDYGNSSFCLYLLEKEGTDLPSKSQSIIELFKAHDYWMFTGGFANEVRFIPLDQVHFYDKRSWIDIKRSDKKQVFIYLAIALLILLVSVLNYLNMTVAQSGFRGKEAAIKKLLGGNRSVLTLQLLLESLLMTTAAFLIGLALALLTEPFFNRVLDTELHIMSQFTPGIISLLVLFVVLVSLVSGIIPALIISGFKPLEVVKGVFSKKVKSSYSRVLISFQYVIAITLLICSLFIIKQFRFLSERDLGFDKDLLYVIDNSLFREQAESFKDRLGSLPAVEAVSLSSGTPLDRGNNMSFEIEGGTVSFQVFSVDTSFFRIFDIKYAPSGIDFTGEAVILNRTGLRALGLDESAVSFVRWNETIDIAGIAEDFHYEALHIPIGPAYIQPLYDYWPPWSISILISGHVDPFETAREIERIYKEFSPSGFYSAEFADQTVNQWYANERRTSNIMNAFALLTIVIMIMGVFAMSLYMLRQKEKEIAIRKVNGSTIGEILLLLNRVSAIRLLISFLLACPIAYFAIDRWLDNFAYKIQITVWPFIWSGLAVFLLSIISISWQSWRAAKANPVESMKAE